MNASLRFLIIAAAIALWLGAVATAGEPAARSDGQAPSVAMASPSDSEAAPAQAGGGEAPVEASEASSEE